MTTFVALLRAVNVGGTGKLPMSDLKAMCEDCGFARVQTYIASGNVVFTSRKSEVTVKSELEDCLASYAGKPVAVAIRTAGEMAKVCSDNPFPAAPANWTVAIFLDKPPPADALNGIRGRADEEIGLGRREIYVHYGAGLGRSKLIIPAAKDGTARNMNTIAKLAEMAAEL
ncbi:DUF1697 domain-containing protein [Bradyrhizobium sp. LHD-71]|uniref:DUF1697 domain-containing protein n=1 Tax=Bradyrhizobium sp. LHD-71 TaxID=3072141 RepID=UPI00280D0C13|nr:DUF1697 domain-containing protein [Bradyrhizobium sp. LHD-71]MDQ8731564.1 DUF1697 domain-containing protein [Bradyrhizobium sp. LHD-71]